MFEPFAEACIDVSEVFGCESLAVGWIDDHDCFAAVPVEVLDVGYGKLYVFDHSGCLGVAFGRGDCHGVDV